MIMSVRPPTSLNCGIAERIFMKFNVNILPFKKVKLSL
jgi:hypothetical protein